MEGHVVPRFVGREVPCGQCVVELHRQVGAHERVLAALAREQERDVALRLADAVEDAAGDGERRRRVGGRSLDGVTQLGAQVGFVGRHDRQACCGVGGVRPLARLGEPCQVARLGCQVGVRCRLGSHVRPVVSGDQHQFDVGRAQPWCSGACARVLGQGDVEVRAAEAERADGPATFVIGSADPRPTRRVEVERRCLEFELVVRPLDLGGLWQHLVVQRHDHLEQTGGTGSRLGVADLALHRAERTPLAVGASGGVEHLRQTTELGRIAGHGAGAVGLDELDRGRSVSGLGIGVVERSGLAGRHGCVHALRPPVGTGAHPVDHAVDVVAIALGVGESLEGNHADSLAEHRSVGSIREGADVLGLRQCRRLREAHVHEDLVHGVDTTRDHHVAVAQVQLVHPHRDRRERRRARSVGDAIGTAEIEPVGDAAGNDVAEQAGERALGPARMEVGDLLAGGLSHVFGHACATHALQPQWTVHPADHRTHQLLAGGDTEDDRHA